MSCGEVIKMTTVDGTEVTLQCDRDKHHSGPHMRTGEVNGDWYVMAWGEQR